MQLKPLAVFWSLMKRLNTIVINKILDLMFFGIICSPFVFHSSRSSLFSAIFSNLVNLFRNDVNYLLYHVSTLPFTSFALTLESQLHSVHLHFYI